MLSHDNELSIEALPMFSYAIEGALDAAREQLEYTEEVKHKPHVLDDELISQIIQSYTKQNDSIAQERATCQYWKKGKLSASDKASINLLLRNLDELERINQQILFIAQHCKEHSIDKILAMDEIELALSYLRGDLYPPTGFENKKPEASRKNKQSSFKLPPKVTCQKKERGSGEISYTFRHAQWGELGRIEVIPKEKQSQINAYVANQDQEDPLSEIRLALFHTIALDFNNELSTRHGKGITARIPDLPQDKRVVESKVMVCETCDAPVAMLIFAPDAYTSDMLEDYARMMYSNTKKLNLPTWVLGAEEEIVPGREGMALILKTWPIREPARKISSLVFEPMLHKLQTRHCKAKGKAAKS